MDWIAGIGRNGGGQLCVKAQGLDGSLTLMELASIRTDLGSSSNEGKAVRRKVSLPLHELRVGNTTTREYLDGLGLNALDADGQSVYEVSTSAGVLVIPAQLLILAVLGANSQVRRVLLRPWGPSFLMCAFAEHGGSTGPKIGSGSVNVRPTPHRMLQLQLKNTNIASRLEWVLSYPSGTAAWSSVYRHALDGRFAMDIPKGFASATVLASPVSGKLLVTRLQVMSLTPTDEPHPFATEYAKCDFMFNEGVDIRPTHGKAEASTSNERFTVSRLGPETVTRLNDEQWLRIEPLVRDTLQTMGPSNRGGPRTHSLREMIDVIRLKLGVRYSWSTVPVDKKLVNSAKVLLSKLTRHGVWEAIVAAGH